MPSNEVIDGEVVDEETNTRLTRRRSAITPKRREVILEKVKEGASLSVAARIARVHPPTLIALLNEDMAEKNPMRDWCLDVLQAYAEFEHDNSLEMLKLAKEKGKWEGVATWLERQRRENWARPAQQQVAIVDGNALNVLKQLHGNPNSLPTGD